MRPRDIWNKKTIIAYSRELIPTLAKELETGQLSTNNKPKAGVLYTQKFGMYWWLVRLIPDFGSIYLRWHMVMNAVIHKAALDYNFETGFREKNELTDTELTLFWQEIQKIDSGTENWKQHYLAWLLVWVTSVRPGSFTTCYGYEKGSTISSTGAVRLTDETLRWKDVRFFRYQGTIAFKITFRFVKGHRDPHRNKVVEGTRTFTIFAVNGDRYNLDLAMVMTSWAFSRGLFKCQTIEELYQGQEFWVPRNESMNENPVFLKVDNGGMIIPNAAMHERSLNPKLQEMCSRVGLYSRNTIYSLRRTAIIETRRTEGTETAQELAMHQMQGRAVYSYDHAVLEDFDIANARNQKGRMERDDIRHMFSQSVIKRYIPDAIAGGDAAEIDDPTPTAISADDMQKALGKEATVLAHQNPDFVEKEDAVRAAFAAGKDVLLILGVSEMDIENAIHLRTHLGRLAADGDASAKDALASYESADAARHNALRRARYDALHTTKHSRLEQAKANAKVISYQSTRSTGGPGKIGEAEKEQMGGFADVNALSNSANRYVQALEGLDDSEAAAEALVDEDDDITPEQRLQEDQDHGRTAPTQWKQADDVDHDEVTIQPVNNEDGNELPTQIGRINFHKAFIGLMDSQNSELYCIQCKLDGTVPSAKKENTYSYSQLNKHLKSDFHSRRQQITRAFNIDKDEKGRCPCPCCPDNDDDDEEEEAQTYNIKSFFAHMQSDHGDMMDF